MYYMYIVYSAYTIFSENFLNWLLHVPIYIHICKTLGEFSGDRFPALNTANCYRILQYYTFVFPPKMKYITSS